MICRTESYCRDISHVTHTLRMRSDNFRPPLNERGCLIYGTSGRAKVRVAHDGSCTWCSACSGPDAALKN